MTTAWSEMRDAAICESTSRRRIVLPRRFDIHQVPLFEVEARRATTRGGVLEIDASAVRHMDQCAIDALIAARLRCLDLGGDLVLAAGSVAARVILELTGRYAALNPVGELAAANPVSKVAA